MTKSIVIISGKGGVGKSLVTSTMVNLLQEMKYKVAAIDADTDNPHLSDFLNIKGTIDIIAKDNVRTLVPVTEGLVSVFSSSLVAEDSPIGMLGSTSGELVKDVIEFGQWGNPDYYCIDLPAGAGDEMRATFEAVHDTLVGCILVVQPAHMRAAERIIKLLQLNEINILGVIENMGYYETAPDPRCEKCGKMTAKNAVECKSCKTPIEKKKNYLFGALGAEKLCRQYNLDFLGTIPIVVLDAENGGRKIPKEHRSSIEKGLEIAFNTEVKVPGFLDRAKGKVKEITTSLVAPMLVDLWMFMNKELEIGALQAEYGYSGNRLVKMVLLNDAGKTVASEYFRVTDGRLDWMRPTKDNREALVKELNETGVTLRAKTRALASAFNGKLVLSNGKEIPYNLKMAVLNGDITPIGQRGDMVQTLGFLNGVYERMQEKQPKFMLDFVARLA